MKYLKKTWFRVIVSLLIGGIINEIIHITTGDPDRPAGMNLSLVYGILCFIVLTILIKRKKQKV